MPNNKELFEKELEKITLFNNKEKILLTVLSCLLIPVIIILINL